MVPVAPQQPASIQTLSAQVAALIAAGEIVERPASVVKELIENALDAQAKAINIELRDGGLRLIRISDDGVGMSRSDVPRSLQNFATSKIRQAADLSTIQTYGFRGEALSSINAVSHLEILTRAAHELEGTHLIAQGDNDNDVLVQPEASPIGVQISVSHLFTQIPARRKFLKSPLRETELAQRVVERYALAHPNVAFRFMVDDRPKLILTPGSTLERIGAIWGRDVSDEMQKIEWEALDLKIRGYISTPNIGRSRRDRQQFLVNGRPVRSGLLAVMLERPYAGRLPPGRYPVAVINIDVDPSFIDVNVHPQKTEIRFSRERSIYTALSQAVGEALTDFPRQVFADDENVNWPFEQVTTEPQPLDANILQEATAPYQINALRPLAQIHTTYILAQANDSVLIVDQHTAHEQVLYEQCSSQTKSQDITAVPIHLTSNEADLLSQAQSLFERLGFELEAFGGTNFLLRQIPAALQPYLPNQVVHQAEVSFEASLVTTLLQELAAYPSLDADAQFDKLAQKAACVCAIKSGDFLSLDTMQQLLNDLAQTWSPAACPHGRPIFVNLSLAEIERRFGRR
ncbi:MAG: DNA mismatch repair endonuclease MutL [Chloroflexota bacterium]